MRNLNRIIILLSVISIFALQSVDAQNNTSEVNVKELIKQKNQEIATLKDLNTQYETELQELRRKNKELEQTIFEKESVETPPSTDTKTADLLAEKEDEIQQLKEKLIQVQKDKDEEISRILESKEKKETANAGLEGEIMEDSGK